MNMKTAFVFPGQGSQSIGMLSALSEEFSHVNSTFAEASDALGYDLWQLVSNGTPEDLNQTDRTQPAMLAAGIAVWRCWSESSSIIPAYLAGHSLGEYTALVAAGALDFADAIQLVAARGQFMQQAVPAGTGAMAAILGLENEAVKAICAENAAHGVVEAVNFNSPGQVVIAGNAAAVDKAIASATEQGAKRAILLPVSVPSHCALMQPAAVQLTEKLANTSFNMPIIPVIHNVNVATATSTDDIRSLLAQQVQAPVRWSETVQFLAAQGVEKIVECGPGKVLAGLTKRIDKSITAFPVFDPASLEKARTALGETA